ncbi:MAG: cobalt-precorrin-2 C(20)-methyltransferase [Synergistales bacterium]|nr:cobalt-precorrin-2 C(20)-methyltransferase [Synergistales bacterium]
MKRTLIGIGVGPGDPDLVTVGAIKALKEADVALLPLAKEGGSSVAGSIVKSHLDRDWTSFVFPMKGREEERDGVILDQLERLRPLWEGATTIALPVIGDSTLYATVAWLFMQWRKLDPYMELRLIPGISAHSLAAARTGSFLAMGEERLSILPGTAPYSDLRDSLHASDCAAIYKPSALGEDLPRLMEETGPWPSAIRITKAGLPEERIEVGESALSPCEDYLSILILRRQGEGE